MRVILHAFQNPLTLTLENQFQTFSTDCILAVVSPASGGEGIIYARYLRDSTLESQMMQHIPLVDMSPDGAFAPVFQTLPYMRNTRIVLQ
ncbi:MAG: hypothetical protein HW386_2041 [Gammaproteobacteria bacterium]|nr:hypothetical protein [Gammaproteobacteria bacterium]